MKNERKVQCVAHIAVSPPKLWIKGVGFVVVSVIQCFPPQCNLNVWVTLK